MNIKLSNEWLLLQQESYLIRTCLANGLTDIRKANLDSKGLFYSGFYHLAIGLERLMKVTLIINHMQENQLNCPTTGAMKAYGHDLRRLLTECQKIANTRSLSVDLLFSASNTKNKILDLLNDYSKGLRYHNLDSLTSTNKNIDPLERWDQILKEVFKSEVSKRTQRNIAAKTEFMKSMLGNRTFIMFHDLSQNPLKVEGYILEPNIINAASPYVIWHIIEIIREINVVQFCVAELAFDEGHKQKLSDPKVPNVREFYDFLMYEDKSYHLRKKKWP